MYLWGFLTKALIFKPQKTTDGWEHKNGFYVPWKDVNTAFSIIESAKNKRKYSYNSVKRKNYYQGASRDQLRGKAEGLLYEIQSSSNNYIEAICVIGGFFLLTYLVNLITVIWSYPTRETVRLFLIVAAVLGSLIFIYFKKKKIDEGIIENFLDVEDALFQHEYGESQYKN